MKLRTALLLLAFGPVLPAQSFHAGLHLAARKLGGDLGGSPWFDSPSVGGFGLEGLVAWDRGHALALRLESYDASRDHAQGGLQSPGTPTYAFQRSYKATTLALDYQWFPGGEAGRGWFLEGGLGYHRAKLSSASQGSPTGPWVPMNPAPGPSLSETSGSVQVEAGAGYFPSRHFGVELRQGFVRPALAGERFSAPTTSLDLVFRY